VGWRRRSRICVAAEEVDSPQCVQLGKSKNEKIVENIQQETLQNEAMELGLGTACGKELI